jgi:GT2 family glycosyltransferase
LLDGVFLAAKAMTLRSQKVRFAPELAFHFYDLDFCIRAHRAGLRLGVWPIAMTHFSAGQYRSESWNQTYKVFCQMNWPNQKPEDTSQAMNREKPQRASQQQTP